MAANRNFFFLFFLLLSSSLCSQESFYTVYIGTFVNAKSSDFEQVKKFGFVYARNYDGNLRKIYAGGFNSREKAETLLSKLQEIGYPDCFISAKKLDPTKDVFMIQLALVPTTVPFDWSPFLKNHPLYVQITDEQMKIMTGPFTSVDEAREKLKAIRKDDFPDAFPKTINQDLLIEITAFELGHSAMEVTADIPLHTQSEMQAIKDTPPIKPTPQNTNSPTNNSIHPNHNATLHKPQSHSKIKRTSVLALQSVLKEEHTYFNALDGIFGWGTANGFEKYVSISIEWQKYALLAQQLPPPKPKYQFQQLETAIANIPSDPTESRRFFEQSEEAVAKAWLAYLTFLEKGWGTEVDKLMNDAVKKVFSSSTNNQKPSFDPRFTYKYDNLEQFILHLRYIQESTTPESATPCWLFDTYPKETKNVYAGVNKSLNTDFKVIGCDRFLEWEELQILHTIAADLSTLTPSNETLLSNRDLRSQLFLAPVKLNPNVITATGSWNDKIWNALLPRAAQDPLYKKMIVPFQIAFYQSLLLLEDFFMNRGFEYKEAEMMGLFVLKTIVDPYLSNYYQ